MVNAMIVTWLVHVDCFLIVFMIVYNCLFFFYLVWNLETGKCLYTFKHRHAISSVALGEEMCISGCEAGRVKVWDLKSGELIKVSLF